MEEKVLTKSEQYDVKRLFKWSVMIGVIVAIVVFGFFIEDGNGYDEAILNGVAYIVLFAFGGWLPYMWLRSYELTITNKRIYGKVAWGKRVDLPVDSVSATAMVPLFKGVSVSTSSGKISFLVIKNADEIYTVMNNLLIERQQEKEKPTATTTISQQSDEADQLKKYKELLDGGVISQEEFDAKKKQLLGL